MRETVTEYRYIHLLPFSIYMFQLPQGCQYAVAITQCTAVFLAALWILTFSLRTENHRKDQKLKIHTLQKNYYNQIRGLLGCDSVGGCRRFGETCFHLQGEVYRFTNKLHYTGKLQGGWDPWGKGK
jgi:hypothetical protein